MNHKLLNQKIKATHLAQLVDEYLALNQDTRDFITDERISNLITSAIIDTEVIEPMTDDEDVLKQAILGLNYISLIQVEGH